MNQRALFWLLLSLVLTGVEVYAENQLGCWSCAKEQFTRGEYQRATITFERIYMLQTSDSAKSMALAGKLDCLLALDRESEIRRCFNRLNLLKKDNQLSHQLAIKEALYFMKLDKLDYAEFKLNSIPDQELDSSQYFNYWVAEFTLSLRKEDQEMASEIYSMRLERNLGNIEETKWLNKRRLFKSRRTAKLLSTFLPGLGQVYAGRPDQAAISIFLTAGSGLYTAMSFITGYNVTAVLTGIPLTIKFYLGGRENAYNLVDLRNIDHGMRLVENIKSP